MFTVNGKQIKLLLGCYRSYYTTDHISGVYVSYTAHTIYSEYFTLLTNSVLPLSVVLLYFIIQFIKRCIKCYKNILNGNEIRIGFNNELMSNRGYIFFTRFSLTHQKGLLILQLRYNQQQ